MQPVPKNSRLPIIGAPELAEAVAARSGIAQNQVQQRIENLFSTIRTALIEKKEASISPLGQLNSWFEAIDYRPADWPPDLETLDTLRPLDSEKFSRLVFTVAIAELASGKIVQIPGIGSFKRDQPGEAPEFWPQNSDEILSTPEPDKTNDPGDYEEIPAPVDRWGYVEGKTDDRGPSLRKDIEGDKTDIPGDYQIWREGDS